MPRNRVIYQSEVLYVSEEATSTGENKHAQLERVQSANYSFGFNKQDINQYGQLARIDSLLVDPATVSVDFSYYLTDGYNERALGFYVQTGSANKGGFVSGHTVESSGKNLFITTVGEGFDAAGKVLDNNHSAIGIGNAYLTDYSIDLSVGNIATASISMEAANAVADNSASAVDTPAINQKDGSALTNPVALPIANTGQSEIAAIRAGDIEITITPPDGSGFFFGQGDNEGHIQSFSLSVPLSRSPLQRLGSKFPFARSVDFPVVSTASINAIVNETDVSRLDDIISKVGGFNIQAKLKDESGNDRLIYEINKAEIDNISFSSSIGSNKSVDISFTNQVGGPNDLDNGIFVSGANATPTFM